jgi:hypothetical protein
MNALPQKAFEDRPMLRRLIVGAPSGAMLSVTLTKGIGHECPPTKGVLKNIRSEGLANEDPEWAALDSSEVTRFRFVVAPNTFPKSR